MSILIMPISGMKERRVDVQPEEKELEVSFAKKNKKNVAKFFKLAFLKIKWVSFQIQLLVKHSAFAIQY